MHTQHHTQKHHSFSWTLVISLLALFLVIEITCGLFVVKTLIALCNSKECVFFPFTIAHITHALHLFFAIGILSFEAFILKTCLHNIKNYEITEIKEQKREQKSS